MGPIGMRRPDEEKSSCRMTSALATHHQTKRQLSQKAKEFLATADRRETDNSES
jgi:hypothetical protein